MGFEECAGGGGGYGWECGGEGEGTVLIVLELVSCECMGADARWGWVALVRCLDRRRWGDSAASLQ